MMSLRVPPRQLFLGACQGTGVLPPRAGTLERRQLGALLGRAASVLVAPEQTSTGRALSAWAGAGAAAALALVAASGSATSEGQGRLPAWAAWRHRAVRCEAAAGTAVPAAVAPQVVQNFPSGVRLQATSNRLYQFESCPFCRKVRSCLDYHKIPYELVEVNPMNKDETKPIAPDYPKVPILQVSAGAGQDFQMRDSKTIVMALLGDQNPGVAPGVPLPGATPSTGKMWAKDGEVTGSAEEQWVKWTDLVLVQCIVLNVYRNLGESAETFSYLLTHPNFSWFAQYSGALSGTVVMWGVSKARKRKFEIADERVALYEALVAFAEAVKGGGGRFLGGRRPGAVDFNVYGILRSAEGCQTERDMFEHCPDILPWYNSMQEAVGPSCAVNAGSIKRGAS